MDSEVRKELEKERRKTFVERGKGRGSVLSSEESNHTVWTFSLGNFNPTPRMGKEITYINKASPFSQYFKAFKDDITFEVIFNQDNPITWFS